jgi:hypothetical protein
MTLEESKFEFYFFFYIYLNSAICGFAFYRKYTKSNLIKLCMYFVNLYFFNFVKYLDMYCENTWS